MSEKVTHDAIRELVQHIWDVHAIRVNDISVDWTDESNMGKTIMRVRCVDIRTQKYS